MEEQHPSQFETSPLNRDEAETSADTREAARAFFSDPHGETQPLPARIASYTIERIIGQGGMGAVYLARQENPKRTVALKVIRPGSISRDMLRRFEVEAHVLGRLHHPGIAQIYEAGTFDAGAGAQPFFAMEYVRGRSLSELVLERSLTPNQSLELLARICDAVHHAHQKGVIHRDLKPGNILVIRDDASTDRDDPGQPKILDFGVARATNADIQATTVQTNVGQLIGTLPYMSPEQVAGNPDELDIRSDVYALGVVGYEMLAGRLPHDLSRATVASAARIISEEEAAPLSAINRTLRGDVETIIAKALEKEKVRRYQSAADLASDIRRYLADEPIVARPPTTLYQLGKFARRNRALVGGVVATFIVLVAGVVVSSIGFAQALEQKSLVEDEIQRALSAEAAATAARLRAEKEAAKTSAINTFLVKELLGAANPAVAQGEIITVEMVLEEASKRVETSLADQPELAGFVRTTLGDTYLGMGKFEEARRQHERAMETFAAVLGADHEETLTAAINLASTLTYLGRPADAEKLLRDRIPVMEEMLGAETHKTLTAKSVLATVLNDQGRFVESEPLFQQIIEAQLRVLGEEHDDTQVAMNNYAYLLSDLGRFDEAEPIFRRIYDSRVQNLGELHPRTLTALGNLAVTLSDLGRYDDAENLYRHVLETSRRVLGDEHPSTHGAMSNLAVLLSNLGKLDEAAPLLQETVELIERTLGPEHPRTLTTKFELVALLRTKGESQQAIELGVSTLDVATRVLGDDHQVTLNGKLALGVAYYVGGEIEPASELFREVYRVRLRTLGPQHPQTIVAMNNAGAGFLRLSRTEDAEPLLVGAMEARQALYGDEHIDVHNSRNLIGQLREEQGRLEEAAEQYQAAWKGRGVFYGEAHQETLVVAASLFRVLKALDRTEEARTLAEAMLNACREALGEEAEQTTVWRNRLAELSTTSPSN